MKLVLVYCLIGLCVCANNFNRRIDRSLVEECVADAVKTVGISVDYGTIYPNNLADPVLIMRHFGKRQQDPRKVASMSRSAKITELATRLLAERSGRSIDFIRRKRTERMFQDAMTNFCDAKPVRCNRRDRYRRIDGQCNNLQNPLWGAAITAQPRFLPPKYGDRFNSGLSPRVSVTRGDLPNPRDISNAVNNGGTTPARHCRFNVLLTHFGQFVDHDVTSTPMKTESDGKMIRCCKGNEIVNRPECFSFKTPPGEFETTCMDFVRSETAPKPHCSPGPCSQVNQVTSYLDLSVVYGSSEIVQKEITDFKTGKLFVGRNNLLPDASTGCVDGKTCFKGGEDRNSEIPLLNIVHVLFLREHNRLVDELSSINPGWSGKTLYQEAKKLLTAIYQHIVYNEFLPFVLGRALISKYALKPSFGDFYVHNIDAGSRSAFGGAAFRFGHTLVGSFVGARDNFKDEMKVPLEDEFNNPDTIRDSRYGVDGISRWMLNQFSSDADRFISSSIRNKLFQTRPRNGFDLSALNIQRGRDHGLPSYNEFRKFCRLRPALYFTTGYFGFSDSNRDAVRALKKVYKHPDDVDLWAGGISELPVHGGVVGPTFGCLIGLQFHNFRFGDRFFYGNINSLTGFSKAQLAVIQRQTLSSLFCRNFDIKEIQEHAFVSPQSSRCKFRNLLESCKLFPSLDKQQLQPWRDSSFGGRYFYNGVSHRYK